MIKTAKDMEANHAKCHDVLIKIYIYFLPFHLNSDKYWFNLKCHV